MAEINKKTLEYLAGLGKLELKEKDEEKLLKDLGNILNYFEELKEIDTEGVEPMAGGTIETNIMRDDEEDLKFSALNKKTQNSKITDAFPDEKGGFLKIPPVFE